MKKKSVLWIALLALLMLWPATVVWADDPDGTVEAIEWSYDDGKTFFNEDVTVKSGEVFEGSLGVFNGNLTLEEGSEVNGDVFVSDGDAYVAGRVNGSLAVIKGSLTLTASGWVTGDLFGMDSVQEVAGRVGGDLSCLFGETTLRSTAVVEGSVLGVGDGVTKDSGAQILGGEMQDIPIPDLPFLPEEAEIPELVLPEVPELEMTPPALPEWTPPQLPEQPWPQHQTFGQRLGRLIGRALGAVMMTLGLLAVGALIVVIWPRQTQQVADCVGALPLQCLGMGLLTFLIAAGLEVLAALLLAVISVVAAALMATVILIPVGLLLILLGGLLLVVVPLVLAAAMLFGWVALAGLVGRKVLKALKVQNVTPLGAIVVGLLATIWLPVLLWLVQSCCLAWPVMILLTSFGLGAVILTRFGTRPCQSIRTNPVALPPSPPVPVEEMDQEAGRPDGPPAPSA